MNRKYDKTINGFSRLPKSGKIDWVAGQFFRDPEGAARDFSEYWLADEEKQRILDGFSENTISNFSLPYGVAPNFVVNGRTYCVPMVIEESSVVAAASAAAKFWMDRGGFQAEVVDVRKVGQVHFTWNGDRRKLEVVFPELEARLRGEAAHLTENMEKRGGGILELGLRDLSDEAPGLYQLQVTFDTRDSMGANFINSVLESFAGTLRRFVREHSAFSESERELEIVMSILSNYTPDCRVKVWVECPVEDLGTFGDSIDAATFAEKFRLAVRIAQADPYRAATHNKGIFNGVDAVILATGNDFRAVEACGHAFAARDGAYRSLSQCSIQDGLFRFWMELPLAIGTVGGLTRLHPLARRSLEMLGNPGAREMMAIVGAVGLAQNFSAVRSLITTGIQKGHMKMHLTNILCHLGASREETAITLEHFHDKVVSFNAVRTYLESLRSRQQNHSQ